MNKKRIRQMNSALLRRLCRRPASEYLAGRDDVLRGVSAQSYMQRFAPLFDGARLRCDDVLVLCRPELDALCPAQPPEGWLLYSYNFARSLLFPSQRIERSGGAGAMFFLSLLQVLFAAEREMLPFDPAWDFSRLTDEELSGSNCADAYTQMWRCWQGEYVYEMMRLGLEATPYRTLWHIAGVHHVALTAGRALQKAGVALDLGLVSGAAAGHDIGKFGCREGEAVPYLHYYYTDQWFHRRHMDKIGHVAANHSVWDLELDYLSVGALLLIYADFRVKQSTDASGQEVTRISSLAEAFDVILQKLDNVNEAKRLRYTHVYAKLYDFEQFMVSRGVDVTLAGQDAAMPTEKHAALMSDEESLQALTMRCVGHNIELMNRLTDQRSFEELLELARGETDWRRLRVYLNIFESYSLYLHIPQKVQTLDFLYELLMHREGDIRRQAASLMGEMIAGFHTGYVKQRPADSRPDPKAATDLDQWKLYLDKVIYPDHKLMPQHRRWISYTLKFMVNALLLHGFERATQFLAPFFAYYRRPAQLDDQTAFQLLETAVALPPVSYTPSQLFLLQKFADTLCRREDVTIRAAAMVLLDQLRRHDTRRPLPTLRSMDCQDSPSLQLLRQDILGQGDFLLSEAALSDIFLSNLKTGTPWIIKQINIRLLLDHSRSAQASLLHMATHLANLIKVSDRVTVRHRAGNALLELAPRLSAEQRNEIAVELCRALELEQQEFTKYVPDYLGRFALWLPPEQLEEVLSDLAQTLCTASRRVVASVLDTVGVMYEEYDAYRTRFPEPDELYRSRRERLLGMQMRGLAGIDSQTRQEAMFVLSRRVFGSSTLSEHEKRRAFLLIGRKILVSCAEESGDRLTFYYRASLLGRLYRFITDQRVTHGGFHFAPPRPVAFFPGTFDPFTLSHKGIVRAIRDLGFEVLLAVDEFSWSKRTQPYRLRRRIAAISVADEFHVQIFPEDFPVNIANPDNLRALRQAFPGRTVSIVVGSDVVAHASSYQKAPTPDSIHTFDHVIFRRSDGAPADYRCIQGKVVTLTLPPELEEISSTLIRDAVDANRDVSHLIDPTVQEFIYRRGLYLREPQDKPLLQPENLEFTVSSPADTAVTQLLGRILPPEEAQHLAGRLHARGDTMLLVHHRGGEALGAVAYQCLDSQHLFARLAHAELSGYVRQNSGGRVLLFSGLFVPDGAQQADLGELLLSEVLTQALSDEYTYALYCPAEENGAPAWVRLSLLLMGFAPVPASLGRDVLAADMRSPIVLSRNVDSAIKAPLSASPRVQEAIGISHRRLQAALTKLQPGSLVLSLSAGIIRQRLLQRITACNGVPAVPVTPRHLGPDICVPYGKILRGVAVPNTVTKTLRTDKVYGRDLSTYSIEAYPDYSPLEDQVRTLRAFDRPLILVDDMLHDGKRLRRLAPLLEQTHTQVDMVLVGYLTGMGRDLMAQLGYPVDSIYYLPNLRMRFVESTLYPFIGGDAVQHTEPAHGGLHPSVNRILPYAAPEYAPLSAKAAWELSLCCLENACRILLAVETSYRTLFVRSLTLGRLGEAVTLPLCPDKGGYMRYDLSRVPSSYLEEDIELLKRMKPVE